MGSVVLPNLELILLGCWTVLLCMAQYLAAYFVENSKIGWLVHPQNMSNHIDTVTSSIQAHICFFSLILASQLVLINEAGLKLDGRNKNH